MNYYILKNERKRGVAKDYDKAMINNDYQADYEVDHLTKLIIWGFDFWVTRRFVKLYADRLYEPVSSRLVLAMQKRLPTKALIMDLGAHYGYYSLLLASRGPQPIMAVEPIGSNTQVLKKNIIANSFKPIQVVQAAVSDQTGEREMRVSVASDSSSFNPHPTGPTLKTEKVQTKTINTLAGNQQVGFIKIDVEGHELPTLQGGTEVIKRDHPAILFEYHPESQRLAGRGKGELLTWLQKLDYRLWAVSEDQAQLVPLEVKTAHRQALAAFGHEGYGNILALMIPLPGLSLIRTTLIDQLSPYPMPGIAKATSRKLELDDTGIGLVTGRIPRVTDWDRWWLQKDRDFYREEFERVDKEVKMFKHKRIYMIGQGIKSQWLNRSKK